MTSNDLVPCGAHVNPNGWIVTEFIVVLQQITCLNLGLHIWLYVIANIGVLDAYMRLNCEAIRFVGYMHHQFTYYNTYSLCPRLKLREVPYLIEQWRFTATQLLVNWIVVEPIKAMCSFFQDINCERLVSHSPYLPHPTSMSMMPVILKLVMALTMSFLATKALFPPNKTKPSDTIELKTFGEKYMPLIRIWAVLVGTTGQLQFCMLIHCSL